MTGWLRGPAPAADQAPVPAVQSLLAALAVGSATLLLLGLTSGPIKSRFSFSEPLIALGVGIALGPQVSGLFHPKQLGLDSLLLLEYGALITLALSVMGAALRLPPFYIRRHWRELGLILSLGMLLMALSSGLIAWALLPVSLLGAALIGAMLAPTDPVLADSIVTGSVAEKNLPQWMRDSISAESGANDGLASILVMLPLMLMDHTPDQALHSWLAKVVLQEVLGGVALGLAIGWPCGLLLERLRASESAERISLLTTGVALAFTTLSLGELLHVNGILATFTAGALLKDRLHDDRELRHEHMQAAARRFFDLPIIILFGAVLPWGDWMALGPTTILAAFLILLLRRLPAWWLLWRALPSLHSRRDAIFNGWFGPIGIAAIYYALMAHEQHGTEVIWPVVSLVVCASIVLHGISATPFTRRYRPAGERAKAPDRSGLRGA